MELESVLALDDDSLLDWFAALRPRHFRGTWFKRLPWSDELLMVDETMTVGDVRQQIEAAKVGRREGGMG